MMTMRHATFERVTCPAIRAHRTAVRIQRQKYAWMPADGIHMRVGTIQRQIVRRDVNCLRVSFGGGVIHEIFQLSRLNIVQPVSMII